jgi:putative mRNA 3-end processing factor
VDYAVITHAHSDHARPGMRTYVAHEHTVPILKYRLGNDISATGYPYNSSFRINGVNVSFHPAGHIIGSAQVRVEYRGEIWVASGDYKLEYDGFSPAFEPVRCHVFISESTFGLPLFKWKPQGEIFSEIGSWWRENAEKDVASVILGYSLGKAQRILQNIDYDAGPVYCHGAIDNINRVISSCGISVRPCERVMPHHSKSSFRKALVIAPTSAVNSPWLRRFEPYSLGIASGWMALRGIRRRRAADRGFALSDHADWNDLNTVVRATGAEKVYVTHGYTSVFSRWLNESNIPSGEVTTEYEGELSEINNAETLPNQDTV